MKQNEIDYLVFLNHVANRGRHRTNRTGIDTRQVFGAMLSYDTRDTFNLFTTKRIHFRSIWEELRLFLSGNTDTTELERRKVRIWKGNTRREFLDRRGLTTLPEGDLGCGYPHQWRNFGGEHPHLPETTGRRGVDQIQLMIDRIKNDPHCRRIVLTGTNPEQEHLMALPPCHNYFQVDVDTEAGQLDGLLVMRSNDLFLGHPFNVAQYDLLLKILGKLTGYKSGILKFVMADAHVYVNHLEQVRAQTARDVRDAPTIDLPEAKTLDDVLNWEYGDMKVVGYNPHPRIKADMAV